MANTINEIEEISISKKIDKFLQMENDYLDYTSKVESLSYIENLSEDQIY